MRNLRLGLRVLALCGTTVLLLASAGSAQQALWPNLRPKPASQLLISDPTTGGKELRFSVTSYNWGLGPLELRAGETGSQGQNVYQRVYNDDGTHTDYFAGTFVWHPAHNHFHFGDYALYSLAPINAPGGSPKSGSKTTFCVMDTAKVDGSLPGAPQHAVYAVCGSTIQGMSVGWGDTYGYHLEGQSIDITGNPSGDYCLTIQIDPKGKLCEADEPTDCGSSRDNTASSLVRIDVERNTVTVLDNTGCAVGGEVVVASISPASAAPGSTIPVTITGSGFAPGATLTFEGGSGPPPAAKNVVVVDENTVKADVTVKKGKPGKDPVWDVRVGSGILFNGFRVQ
jgi:Lysyl oxidase